MALARHPLRTASWGLGSTLVVWLVVGGTGCSGKASGPSGDGGSGGGSGSSSGSGSGGSLGGAAMPGVCMATCANDAPNNVMSCYPCLMSHCASQYAACQADAESGCISCADMLSGGDVSGQVCTGSEQILMKLLECGCLPTTCN